MDQPDPDADGGPARELDEWLSEPGPRTVGGLVDRFGPRSFPVAVAVLLAFPAMPLPTGGISHAGEAGAVLIALEAIVGRRDLWLPQRVRRVTLDGDGSRRVLGRLIGLIRAIERRTRPGAGWMDGRVGAALWGLAVALFSVTAFVAPPFSGLDTLPAMGAVVLSVGGLTGSRWIAVLGLAIGIAGIGLLAGVVTLLSDLA